jgi:hypothetical protein
VLGLVAVREVMPGMMSSMRRRRRRTHMKWVCKS